ncbi:MAG: Hpt domain-containing protein [Bacteroidales bacterium]|nr:Hpt domain-containing protein [Bacteroidales bacterium]MBN2697229.1 Hpt domain-containing protein [Bacteroidales bacterium]
MIIDLNYLRTLSGGDEQFIGEMVDIFREQVAEYLKEMPLLLEQSDYANLSRLAHKAKSSVAIMGMNDEAEYLKELELMAREGKDPEACREYVNRFMTTCRQVLEELNT